MGYYAHVYQRRGADRLASSSFTTDKRCSRTVRDETLLASVWMGTLAGIEVGAYNRGWMHRAGNYRTHDASDASHHRWTRRLAQGVRIMGSRLRDAVSGGLDPLYGAVRDPLFANHICGLS